MFIETAVGFCLLKQVSLMGINNSIRNVDDDSIIPGKCILNQASKRWWNDMKPWNNVFVIFFFNNETKKEIVTEQLSPCATTTEPGP